jgi:hypothetical protein
MCDTYTEDIVDKHLVTCLIGTHKNIAVPCVKGETLIIRITIKDNYEMCDKVIRLADEYRSNGFVEKEFECYTTLSSLAREQASSSSRLWIALHVNIGEARHILEPVNHWRLDLRGTPSGKFDNHLVVDANDIVRAEHFTRTALGYVTLLYMDKVPRRVVGGEEKFLDTHARVLHLMVKVLFQKFCNAVMESQPHSILTRINIEIQHHGMVLLKLVEDIPNIYLYYSICITNVCCYCRGRIGNIRCEGTIAILEQLFRSTKRSNIIKTLDTRRRQDIITEARKALLELRCIYKTLEVRSTNK